MDNEATPQVPVSWGELIDKITILEIKKKEIGNREALANVVKELSVLEPIAEVQFLRFNELAPLRDQLRAVNGALWKIEDDIREKERKQQFDAHFIELARSVYKQNDRRAALKKEINTLLRSGIVEEKSYKSY